MIALGMIGLVHAALALRFAYEDWRDNWDHEAPYCATCVCGREAYGYWADRYGNYRFHCGHCGYAGIANLSDRDTL